MADFSQHGEALTREAYLRLMEGRERPLTDPYMKQRTSDGVITPMSPEAQKRRRMR